ncbi:MAG TPA: DNA/RNA non-specific endonuclease [Flavisolibacter sp.]
MNTKLALLVAVTVFFVSCKKESAEPTNPGTNPGTVADNDHMLLGNPTNAQSNALYTNNYLKDYTYYKLAYSNNRGTALWVSWHLQSSDIGSAPRQDDFRADNTLPPTFYLVQHSSYSNSGFDRGHNCPSADRTSTILANSSTFFMTNMIPQAPKLNQGPWEGLEDYIRNTLVGASNEAFILMGNYGSGGTGSLNTTTDIDNGHIIVPARVWKIAVVMPKGNNDLVRLDTSAIVLAVNMPNDNNLYNTTAAGKTAWRNYVTTVSNLEQNAAAEGMILDFFSNLSAPVRTYLKSKLFQ